MNPIELAAALLLAAMAIALVAKRLDLPYPIALFLGGLALALIPGVPAVKLDPELVFYLLLPPVLSEAAYFTSWRDFWRWRRPILLLGFLLTTVTSATVAALCVAFIPGMPWSVGFVLGAIVSPPDTAAAMAILRGLKLPKRTVQILEGESLVNDAAALTVYRFAIAAVVSGGFSGPDAALSFLWIATGGIVIGGALGWIYVRIFPLLKEPEIEIVSTFLLSYFSYFLAERVHASGVLACVSSGLILGWHSPRIFGALTRIRGVAFWQVVLFLVNVAIFLLMGLQLPFILGMLSSYPWELLAQWSIIIAGGVILLRIAWVFPLAYLPRRWSRTIRESEPHPHPGQVFVVAWTGLRGVISLASALALPEETATGLPFPYRSLIALLAVAVIIATLVVQGLTLRPIIRRLRLPSDRSSEEEQLVARIHTTERVLDWLAGPAKSVCSESAAFLRVRAFFEDRLADLRSSLEIETGTEAPDRPEQFNTIAEQRLWWETARVEREALLDLRRQQRIGDEALHEIERDIDLLEARIIPSGRSH